MAEQKKSYDIIIVGAGLSGAVLALELSSLDLRIALVDAQPQPPVKMSKPERVIALSYGSRCHLDALDIWQEITQLGAASICKIDVSEAGNSGNVHMNRQQANVEALGYVVQNAHVLQVLHGRLQKKADLYCPANIISMNLADDSATLTIRHQDQQYMLSAALIVGADGTYSQVRRMAGISTIGWDHNRFGLVASVKPQRPHGGVAYECFRPSGPLAFLPLDDQRCSIVWTLRPVEAACLLAASDDEFLAGLTAAAGPRLEKRLGPIVETGPRAYFAFEMRQAKRLSAKRMALIGNAAHTLHPVAGQGLNLGLRDVRTLARTVRRAVNAKRDIGTPIVLEEYAGSRKLDNAAIIGFTEGLNTLFGNDFAPLRISRGLGLTGMQTFPVLRDWLMHQASGISQKQAMESRHAG